MKLKKTAAAVLAASIVGGSISTVSFADESTQTVNEADSSEHSRVGRLTLDGIIYAENDDGTLSVSDVVNADEITSVEIPARINGKSVTGIWDGAFWSCYNLTSVTIPDSVKVFYKESEATAFGWCTSLVAINVSEDNTQFASEDGVLFNKSKTKLLKYPAGKTEQTYTIPDSVTSIGRYAFTNNSKVAALTSIIIPDSVTAIDLCAFSECQSLKSITIPDSVTSIGFNTFNGCSSLESITIPEGITSIGIGAFRDCSNLKSITIPYGVTSIGNQTFENCSSLDSLTIPDSVKAIEIDAFEGCTSLSSVNYSGSAEQWQKIEIYYGNDALKNATIHYNAKPTDADPDWTPDENKPATDEIKFTDEKTGVEVTAASGVLPESVTFNAKILSSTADSNKYDLSFTDAAGKEVQPNGKVTVSLPLPADWDTAYVYRVEGSKKTLLQSNIKNGKVVFTTDHFSVYMLTAKELDTEDEPSTVTPGATDANSDGNTSGGGAASGSDQYPTGIALAVTPIILAAGAVAVASKKKK